MKDPKKVRDEPYKRLAPAVIEAGGTIDVWVRPSTVAKCRGEVKELTVLFTPEWAG